jgi:hypothetical protein
MEDKMRSLHGKNIELETQLQLESRAKRYVMGASVHARVGRGW